MINNITKAIRDSIQVKKLLLDDENLIKSIDSVINAFIRALQGGNKIILAGNGGSAADAQHIAAEFVSKFEFDRPGLPAISLATDTSMITAIGNDYGYEKLFARQLQAQAKSGDIFVGITTSGLSKNILTAFEACTHLGITAVGLCGLGGHLESSVDHLIRVPSTHTPRIQECHILIGHIICAEVEEQMFGSYKLR